MLDLPAGSRRSGFCRTSTFAEAWVRSPQLRHGQGRLASAVWAEQKSFMGQRRFASLVRLMVVQALRLVPVSPTQPPPVGKAVILNLSD